TALLIERAPTPTQRARWVDSLSVYRRGWAAAHRGLQHGDDTLQLPGRNSEEVAAMFATLNPTFDSLQHHLDRLIAAPYAQAEGAVAGVLRHEGAFLRGMDEITFRYAAEARDRARNSTRIGSVIAGVILLTLLAEALLAFRPLVRRLHEFVNSLRESNEATNELNTELEELMNHQAETHAVLEDMVIKLQTVLAAHTQVAILTTDLTGRVDLSNPAAKRVLPHTIDDRRLLGTPLGVDAAALPDLLRRLADGEVRNYQLASSEGQTYDAQVHVSTLYNRSGQATGYLITAHDVTDLTHTQRRLEEEQRFITSMMQAIPGMVYVFDLEKQVEVFVNQQSERILGYAPKELMAMGNRMMPQLLHPDDILTAEKNFEQIERLADGEAAMSSYRFKHRDGGYRWLRMQDVVFRRDEEGMPTRIMGVAYDVTEEHLSGVSLTASHQMLKYYKQALDEAGNVAMVDTNDVLQEVNRNFCELSGWTRPELIGRSVQQLYDDPEAYEDLMMTVRGGEVWRGEIRSRRKDGTPYWEDVTVVPFLDAYGRPFQRLEIRYDISARKQALREVTSAKEQAEASARAKEMFLSTMSHEIRTPLNAVIGMTHLLLADNPRADQLQDLQTLRFSAEMLLALINDILDFNKIEAGHIDLEEADFDLRALLRGLDKQFRYRAEEKGLDLRVEVGEGVPDAVVGDSVRMTQILTNLLGNAMKFTDQGGVTLRVGLHATEQQHVALDFAVSDTGIGISTDKQGAIFEAFTQANSNTTRKFGGTGLGLAITKRLLELQGSRIELESAPGVGATFRFRLRLKRSFQRPVYREAKRARAGATLAGLRVLLVEDNEINRLVATKFLKKWGVTPECAVNGREAVDRVQAELFDVVLMDLQMPVMDGYEAARRIRALGDERYQRLPIIALTASAMLDVRDRVFTQGMNDYLTKPFNPDDLLNKIVLWTTPPHNEQLREEMQALRKMCARTHVADDPAAWQELRTQLEHVVWLLEDQGWQEELRACLNRSERPDDLPERLREVDELLERLFATVPV
ncbi:MAG: PAS domain S-box protein, partial [Catalinimonas sp.]